MGDKGLDFKHKEVINICDGKRLGFVQDVCADLETGTISGFWTKDFLAFCTNRFTYGFILFTLIKSLTFTTFR